MHNLHGGTVIGYTTTLILNSTAVVLSQNSGMIILTTLFFIIMLLSTLLAIGTLIRFFRNHNRQETKNALNEAWLERLRVLSRSIHYV
jgi:hypothetical protein